MTPITPVFDELELPIVEFAKNQPDYIPLPAYRSEDGLVVTRGKLTWAGRFNVLFYGCIWLQVLTFNRALQPVKLTAHPPLAAADMDAWYIGKF